MDPKIRELYNEEILAEVSYRFEISVDALEELDGFESYIYSFEKEGKGYILRIGHSSHRDVNAVQGEAEFIDYLGANGIHVGRPVRDMKGNLVEAIPAAEGEFTAVVFEKVPGQEADEDAYEDGTLMHNLGRMLAKMHTLTKTFEPSDEKYRRLSWDDDNLIVLDMIENGLSEEEKLIVSKQFRDLIDEVNALPRDRENFGLVHFDVHDGNFFLDEGDIYLFDFDDSLYTWFANDIAMVFYYGSYGYRDDAEKLQFLFGEFIDGYNEVSEFNPVWLDYIPAFLMLRRLDLFARVHTDIPKEEWDHFCHGLVDGVREMHKTGRPFLPLDFTDLVE